MALLQHAADHRRWKMAALTKMALGTLSETEMIPKDFSDQTTTTSKARPKRPRYTKSFKRTRSKLVMLYNQAGDDTDELI